MKIGRIAKFISNGVGKLITNGVCALVAVTLLVFSGGAQAQDLKPVSVIVFPGGFNWPLWVAQDKGYFAQNGIAVTLTPTPNSVFQLTNLIDGKFDIGVTAVDNVIAYMEGQGEAPLSREPDLFVFMGGDNGLLALTAVPEIKTTAELKGKTVSVDALTTGYAFVLFDLLERAGLKMGDYKIEKAGGVLARWDALKEKKHAATMLITPFDLIASAIGFNVLHRAIDVYGHYQGLVGATRRGWARDNREKLIGYIRGYRAGLAWLFDPANKDEAIAILRKNLPQMAPQVAAQSYAVLVSPKGFAKEGTFDVEGTKRVLELRSRYGEPKKTLSDPMKYYDASYFAAAGK